MKTQDSMQLGLDSYLSPFKNGKSSVNMDTIASLSLSDINQNELLKLNSMQKQINSLFSVDKLSKISESNVLQTERDRDGADRLSQILQLQRWVHQASNVYELEKTQWRENEAKIKKIQQNNKLKKDATAHIKAMYEYLERKYQGHEKEMRNKWIKTRTHLITEIQQSKQRAEAIMYEITSIENSIGQQKRISQQLEKELKQFQASRNKRKKMGQQSHGYPYNYHYGYVLPHYGHYYNHELSPRVEHSDCNSLRKSPSFEQHHTPQFLSKKTSVCQANNSNQPSFGTNGLIMQVLTANIQSIANANSPQLQPEYKSKVEKKQFQSSNQPGFRVPRTISIDQKFEQFEHNVLYSPTNAVDTPHFDSAQQVESFQLAHERALKLKKANSPQKPGSKLPFYGGVEQSKVRIDIEDSLSDMSKFSIQKRKKVEHIRESTIKIQMQEEDSKSGETSMLSDPTNVNTPRLRSPTMQLKNNSSFQKIQLQQVCCSTSEILNKPLPAPPKLPPNSVKKLRKVTEQESDLFDSSGAPRVEKKQRESKEESETVSIRDMVVDKSQIGISERLPMESGRSEAGQEMGVSKRKNSKKVTDEDEDDQDFMQINLLAVSKISKEKEYSQAFKTISDDGNDISQLKRPSQIYKSQNMLRSSKPTQLENIEQNEQQFIDPDIQKREAKVKRMRKSSGSRFSEIKQPARPTSLEMNKP